LQEKNKRKKGKRIARREKGNEKLKKTQKN
jgi:hypothetical protein